MRTVPAEAARQFFTERADWQARHDEDARRRREESAQRNRAVPTGVPAREGLTAFETMAAAADYETVRDEFGRPAPTFLDEQLEAGQREIARKKAEAEARDKARAADRMREDLG